MAVDLRSLNQQPFELLQLIDQRLRGVEGAGISSAQQQSQWTGLRFSVAGKSLLAPRNEVAEILSPPGYTPVPNAQPWLLGVANVRGNLLPIIDLSWLLLGEASVISEGTRLLTLDSEDTPAGFMVDEVAGFENYSEQEQRHALVEQQADDEVQPFLLGAFVRDGESAFVFSLAKLAASTLFQDAAA